MVEIIGIDLDFFFVLWTWKKMLKEQGMVGLAAHFLLRVGTLRLMLLQKEVVVGQGVQSVQGLVQGTHDSEAGSLAAGGSRRHSEQVQVEEEPEVEDASQYLNDNADWQSDEDQAVQDQLHVQAPAPHEAP
jgi:hypothetical protein